MPTLEKIHRALRARTPAEVAAAAAEHGIPRSPRPGSRPPRTPAACSAIRGWRVEDGKPVPVTRPAEPVRECHHLYRTPECFAQCQNLQHDPSYACPQDPTFVAELEAFRQSCPVAALPGRGPKGVLVGVVCGVILAAAICTAVVVRKKK